jgi:hypothetical protein
MLTTRKLYLKTQGLTRSFRVVPVRLGTSRAPAGLALSASLVIRMRQRASAISPRAGQGGEANTGRESAQSGRTEQVKHTAYIDDR